MAELAIVVDGDAIELEAGSFLIESLWESSEFFIGFPPSVVVRLQFRYFVHVERAVICIEVGDVLLRQ